jgi:hypothetical protein
LKSNQLLAQNPQLNSLIPYEHHHNQNPHAYAHSNQMFQSNLPFGL